MKNSSLQWRRPRWLTKLLSNGWKGKRQKDGAFWYRERKLYLVPENVHRVPITWEEEVQLLQRELDRAWTSLKLEEERNKHLPPLKAADTPEEFAELTEKSVQRMMRFLKDNDIMVIKIIWNRLSVSIWENMYPRINEISFR